MKTQLQLTLAALGLASFLGCTTDANVVSQQISQQAERFEISREISVINGITGNVILEITGACSTEVQDRAGKAQVEITCKVPDGFARSHVILGDNDTVSVKQLVGVEASASRYSYTIIPTTIIPDVEIR